MCLQQAKSQTAASAVSYAEAPSALPRQHLSASRSMLGDASRFALGPHPSPTP